MIFYRAFGIVILLIECQTFCAQNNRNNIWMFGNYTGVDFNSGVFPPPSITNAQTGTSYNIEGSAAICNSVGQLLFYSNGAYIYDKNNNPMSRAGYGYTLNWDSILSGDPSSCQGVLISRFACDTNKYYVFTTDGQSANSIGFVGPKGKWDGLHYTVVNMNLNGGLGDIDVTYLSSSPGYIAGANKIALIDSTNEKITAVPHANGVDYWVVAQRRNKSLISFLVDCNGIHTTPVISSDPSLAGFAGVGGLRGSYDGKCLLICSSGGVSQMADFNNSTGSINNFVTLINGNTYSACFSPNDRIIYFSDAAGNIIRFDRFAINIAGSVITQNVLTVGELYNGPDGRMYFPAGNISGKTTLSVYNSPNNFANPGFVADCVHLSSTAFFGLQNIFYPGPPKISLIDTNICKGDSVTFGIPPIHCATYQWTPALGLSNASVSNPTAFPTKTTTYYLTADVSCYSVINSITITVHSPTLTISGDSSICPGQTTTLTASGASSYQWSPGTGLSSTTGTSVIINTSNPISYTLTGSDVFGCHSIDSVRINIDVKPTANADFDDSICEGQSAPLIASGGITYLWSTSETNSAIIVNPFSIATYTLIAYNVSCSDTDKVTIFVHQPPSVNTGSNTIIIAGNSVKLSASGNGTYLWYPSARLSCSTCANPIATPAETTIYYLLLTDSFGCINLDSVIITVENPCKGFYIPNAFSPNNDGQNDLFYIQADCFNKINLIIYNKWGERIFEIKDAADGWNGTYKGEVLDTDVFYYVFKGTMVSREEVFKKGSISLLK